MAHRLMNRPTSLLMAVLAVAALWPAASASAQPGQARIDSTWRFATEAATPGQPLHAAIEFKVAHPYHVQSNAPADEYTIPTRLVVTPPPGFTVREIVYPESVPFTVAGFDEPLLVFDSEFAIGIALDVGEDVAPGTYPISAELHYQACDNRLCLQPTTLRLTAQQIEVVAGDAPIAPTDHVVFDSIEFSDDPAPIPAADEGPRELPTGPAQDCDVMAELNRFEFLGSAGGIMNATDFIAFIDGAETGTLKRSFFEDKGPLLIIGIVILGGFLLNLTPCVLPLIPINLAIIGAGAQAGSRTRGFALGGAYGIAMAIVYGALGLIVVLTSTAFGTINSTLWFNVAIAILFVFLALAMFDVIAIDFTKYQSNIDATKMGSRGSFALAFFMGCVTALLAGACVAPVVIQVIVYAGDQYARGIAIALALPFFLGLGMALPWPFAGAGLSFLPKPGMWMNWVKKGMGVFILAFAAYYGYLAYGIWRVENFAGSGPVEVELEGGWTADLCAALEQARAEDKPVLIDMWATWCKNCSYMFSTTLQDERVVERLDGYIKVKFQAENLNASPNREMLEKFEQFGLPAYAIVRPK